MAQQMNGRFDSSYLVSISSNADLLVNPATDHIGYMGKQWVVPEFRSIIYEIAKKFHDRIGVRLTITEAWRSYDTQVYYKQHPPTPGAAVATPGTSNHGWGLAVDFGSGIGYKGTAYAAFKEFAEPYGVFNDETTYIAQHEGWHWTFFPKRARIKPASSGATPIPEDPTPDEKDNDMPVLELVKNPNDPSGTVWLAENRMHRRPVPADQMAHAEDFLRVTGNDPVTKSNTDLSIFGVDLTATKETRELVKLRGDATGTVWYSVNRQTRYALGGNEVNDYIYYLGKLGFSTTVLEVANLASFGAVA